MKRSFAFWGGLAFFALFVLAALLAPWIAPKDPMEQSLLDQLLPPAWMSGGSGAHWLGTDNLGRDLLSRLIWGARPALAVMFLGAAASGSVGVTLGMLAGFFGGRVDRAISRLLEVFMSFPPMLLAIVLVAVVGPGLHAVVAAVVLIGWTRFCRVVRTEVMALKELDFVLSARALGMRPMRILFREVFPNLLPVVAVLLGLEMGRAVIVEAVLSFIGFSSSAVATWGGIIADGKGYINQAWWVLAAPIVVIVAVVLALNGLSDALRERIDPVLKR